MVNKVLLHKYHLSRIDWNRMLGKGRQMSADDVKREKGTKRNLVFYFVFFVVTHPLLSIGLRSQPRFSHSTDSVPCSQSTASRDALIRRAEKLRFTVRRVEFVGTTYTRDEVLRRRMTNFQEGDLFTRRHLVNSLKNMSKLRREIYPVNLKNVKLRLNEPEQTVDVTICFRPKGR